MAAATSAIFGSYLGAFGTVGGAAAGAIATTVVTHAYQRSIDSTHQRVVSKFRNPADAAGAEDAFPAGQPRPGAANPARGAQRTVMMLATGALVIFLLALALVTGIEWAKGSSFAGGAHTTSLRGVLHPRPGSPTPTPDTERTPEKVPSGDLPDPSGRPGDAPEPSGSAPPGETNQPSDASCPDGSYPGLLCDPLRLGSRW